MVVWRFFRCFFGDRCNSSLHSVLHVERHRRHIGQPAGSLVCDRQPDLAGICLDIDADIAVFHAYFLAGECAGIFRGISGWNGHGEVTVVIVDGDDHAFSLEVAREGVLAVHELQFPVVAVGQRL